MEDRTLEEVLGKLDMTAYLDREGIEYRESHGSSGLQLNIKTCPACGGDKWKVFLNAETGFGNCFSGSCEKKFNKFTFIRDHLALDNGKTVAHIFQVAREMGWRPPRKSTVAVNLAAGPVKLPHSLPIPIEGRNLRYLANRGISGAIAEYFHMRYCERGLFAYTNDYGDRRFMDFSARIIIPVFDLDGELVTFQGRDITGEAEKKYLFPPGLASTGSHLYNGHNVHNTERVLVGEGVFDVAAQKIALDGDESLRDVVPVGTFGKHLSFGHDDSQMAKFMVLAERGVREVTFMWDGEVKATDDAIRAGMMLKGVGLQVRIASLPADKDPNEVPAEVVRAAFWQAIPLDAKNAVRLKMLRRA